MIAGGLDPFDVDPSIITVTSQHGEEFRDTFVVMPLAVDVPTIATSEQLV
jgi:hypothetical protein